LGEAAGTMDPRCLAGDGCRTEHCDHSGGEAPRPCDENKPDCLCRGAIMEVVRPTEPDWTAPLAVDGLLGDANPSTTALSRSVRSSEPCHQFPLMSAGRDVCVLTCALLL
jgi:hypothetical protein